MIVDGKKIRDEILAGLKEKFDSAGGAVLGVVWVGDDPATAKFIAQKEKFALVAGVDLRLFEYEDSISQVDLEKEISRIAADMEITGIIVQLPLPRHIESKKIIELIPAHKDVDSLTDGAKVGSPVVEAIKEILERHNISLQGKKFAVVGRGKLVGRPTGLWLAGEGLQVDMLDKDSLDIPLRLKQADVIISGVGQPGFISPDMLKDGAVVIDAGTSEQAGQLAGDAASSCALKTSLFTPVPGGVGPIVVAMLFKNLWKLLNLTK